MTFLDSVRYIDDKIQNIENKIHKIEQENWGHYYYIKCLEKYLTEVNF